MFQRRSHRTAPRSRTLALGGALAALAARLLVPAHPVMTVRRRP